MSEQDDIIIQRVTQAVDTGLVVYRAVEVTLGIEDEAARRLLERYRRRPTANLILRSHEHSEVAGVPVDLGPTVNVLENYQLLPADLNGLAQRLAHPNKDERVLVRVAPTEDSAIRQFYENWLPEGERVRLWSRTRLMIHCSRHATGTEFRITASLCILRGSSTGYAVRSRSIRVGAGGSG